MTSESSRGGFPWFRVLIFVLFLGGLAVLGLYEKSAHDVLAFADSMMRSERGLLGAVEEPEAESATPVYASAVPGVVLANASDVVRRVGVARVKVPDVVEKDDEVEEEGVYERVLWDMVLAYQVVVEKYPFSFASISAKERLAYIEAETGIAPSERIATTFIEEHIEWFNPYAHHGFTVFASLACFGTLGIMLLLRLCFGRAVFLVFLSAAIAAGVFSLQMIDSGVWKISDPEPVYRVMEDPRWSFGLCYLLVFISICTLMAPLRRKREVEAVLVPDEDSPPAAVTLENWKV